MNSELKEAEKVIDNSFEQYWNSIMDCVCNYLKLSDDNTLGLRCHVSEIEHDEFAKPIYDLIDRAPSPSGGIKSAEAFWDENYGFHSIRTKASIIEAMEAYHNQFAGDGWKEDFIDQLDYERVYNKQQIINLLKPDTRPSPTQNTKES